MNVVRIQNTTELRALCARAQASGRVGIDTEFVRDRTYYPKLALVQLAVDDEISLVDPLMGIDLAVLHELLSDPTVVKVFHAAGQDLELFWYQMGEPVNAVFDTQIGAALIGLGNQVGYSNLVKEMLGHDLGKGPQYTDWLQRPLSEKQLAYAADDVRYLFQIQDGLNARLAELDRFDAAQEEMQPLSDPVRYTLTAEDLLGKVKGSGGLKSAERAILLRLAVWREEEAQKRDIPRRRVVGDETLTTIARGKPKNESGLERCRGLHAGEIRRSGRLLLSMVAEGIRDPSPPPPARSRPSTASEAMSDLVRIVVKQLCHDLHISPGALAKGSDLDSLVSDWNSDRDLSDHPLMSGWRGDLIGKELAALFEGQTTVGVDPKTGKLRLTRR